jgi:hypothetical protein
MQDVWRLPGLSNLVMRKLPEGHIELNPHAAGARVLTLDEDTARAMCEIIREWLG